MKRFILISILVFLYFLLCSKSCNNQADFNAAREQWGVEDARDSIKSLFGASALSEKSIHAYEKNAKRKFVDFCDYYTILNDPKTTSDFKQHIEEMILGLFLSDSCSIHFSEGTGGKKGKIRLAEVANFKMDYSPIQLDSVWVMKDLEELNDSVFYGKLGFLHRSASISGHPGRISKGTAAFWTIKREKRFGKERLNVWNVFLGDCYFEK
jgi:hypothetical protein